MKIKKFFQEKVNIFWGLPIVGGWILLITVHAGYGNTLLRFFESNFFTSFFGAAAGAVTIAFLERQRRNYKLLSDINMAIGILSGISNKIINIKDQHTLPIVREYEYNFKFKELVSFFNKRFSIQSSGPLRIKMRASRVYCPEIKLNIPLDEINLYISYVPQLPQLIFETQQSLMGVFNAYNCWNDIIKDMKNLNHANLIKVYFAQRQSHMVDSNFPDTVKMLNSTVDDSIWFINKLIATFQLLGERVLPRHLKRRVFKSEFISEKFKKLVPSEDYIKGWEIR